MLILRESHAHASCQHLDCGCSLAVPSAAEPIVPLKPCLHPPTLCPPPLCVQWGTFSAEDACNFALNIYDDGAILSIGGCCL